MEATQGFVNLTPHDVLVYERGALVLTVPKSGTVARLTETATSADPRIDLSKPIFSGWCFTVHVALGAPEGLPEPVRDVTYIVSMPLAMGLKAAGVIRSDVVYPYGQVRDGGGRIIGCERFARIV